MLLVVEACARVKAIRKASRRELARGPTRATGGSSLVPGGLFRYALNPFSAACFLAPHGCALVRQGDGLVKALGLGKGEALGTIGEGDFFDFMRAHPHYLAILLASQVWKL